MTEPMTERKSWPRDEESRGLACRRCGCRHLPVDHTRKVNRVIIRYRRCRHCGQRMTTRERAVGIGS